MEQQYLESLLEPPGTVGATLGPQFPAIKAACNSFAPYQLITMCLKCQFDES